MVTDHPWMVTEGLVYQNWKPSIGDGYSARGDSAQPKFPRIFLGSFDGPQRWKCTKPPSQRKVIVLQGSVHFHVSRWGGYINSLPQVQGCSKIKSATPKYGIPMPKTSTRAHHVQGPSAGPLPSLQWKDLCVRHSGNPTNPGAQGLSCSARWASLCGLWHQPEAQAHARALQRQARGEHVEAVCGDHVSA